MCRPRGYYVKLNKSDKDNTVLFHFYVKSKKKKPNTNEQIW